MQKKSGAGKKRNRPKVFAFVLVLLILVAAPILFFKYGNLSPEGKNGSTGTKSTSATEPKAVTAISTADIVSVGDILIHEPILNCEYNSQTGTYNFNEIFSYVKSVVESADFAVVNLETTLAGADSGGYTGYPLFNTPDAIVDALKNTGFDMLLTANNHTYDRKLDGVLRTVGVIKEKGLLSTGTRADTNQKQYLVKNINGIKIGMMNYTYETALTSAGNKTLNGNVLSAEAAGLVNSFNYEQLDSFYNEAEKNIKAMKKDGAEAIILYIHWGNEYQLAANSYQKEIAQKMCDLGVDAIVGGHPHVIEPVDVLTSGIDGHKTVCIYSVGNFISNQRVSNASIKTGHTEDGVIFRTVFTKYSNGKVALTSVGAVPTWVNKYTANGVNEYRVVPLDNIMASTSNLGLEQVYAGGSQAQKSYQRTMSLISAGMEAYNGMISSQAGTTTTEAAGK